MILILPSREVFPYDICAHVRNSRIRDLMVPDGINRFVVPPAGSEYKRVLVSLGID
jgi:hypothetical protein